MKQIGIKLADGSFYPILEEGVPNKRQLDLTTVKDNQTKVQVDVYRSETGTMEDAEYVDTLEVTKLNPHPNGEPDLHLSVGLDENNELSAEVVDGETGKKSELQVQLVTRTLAERESSEADFNLENPAEPAAFDNFSFDDFEEPKEATPELDPAALAAAEEPFSFDDVDATATEDPLPLPDFDALSMPEEPAAENDAVPASDDGIVADDSLAAFDDIAPEGDAEQAADSASDAPTTADAGTADDTVPDFDGIAPEGDAEQAADSADDAPATADAGTADDTVPDFNDIAPESDATQTADNVSDAPATADAGTTDDTVPDFNDIAPEDDAAQVADSASDAPATADTTDDFSLPEFDTTSLDNDALATIDDSNDANDFALPSFDDLGANDGDAPDVVTEEELAASTVPADATDTVAADDADAPTVTDDVAAAAPADTTADAGNDFDLPDFDSAATPTRDAITPTDGFELPDFDSIVDEGAAATSADTPAPAANDDFALPDFSDISLDAPAEPATTSAADATVASESTPAASDEPATDDANAPLDIASLDLPDFDLPATTTSDDFNTDFDLPDFDNPATNSTGADLDLDDPAFADPIFGGTSTKKNSAKAGGLMDFSDLYDKETLAGGASYANDENEDSAKRKTRVPVIICVICAIICTIATVLVLFIIPSRYNLLTSRHSTAALTATNTVETSAQDANAVAATQQQPLEPKGTTATTEATPELPLVAPARENTIVVAPNAEAVVPVPTVTVTPPPVVTPKKTGDVTYHIKWGDTLWDISDAYYNNPWKYPRIADYNSIQNPDLIIAGTDIKIPKE